MNDRIRAALEAERRVAEVATGGGRALPDECSVDGCRRGARVGGLCAAHYARNYAHGSTHPRCRTCGEAFVDPAIPAPRRCPGCRTAKRREMGPRPYGLRGDPAELDVVRRIFRMVAYGGPLKRGISVSKIGAALAPRGGSEWPNFTISGLIWSDRYRGSVAPIVINRARQALRRRRRNG